MSGEAFSESSAQDTKLAALEAREWIEAVTGKKFKNDSIRESLEDGVLLCELMKKVNPGFIRRINKSKSPIAYLDNIRQFLNGCQNLGMKDAQLFDTMDLQDAKGGRKTGVKRDEADRRIRAVCITLFWLGRTVAELDEYDGPQLDLELFKKLMAGKAVDEEDDFEEEETGKKVVSGVPPEEVKVQPKQQSYFVVNLTGNHLPAQPEDSSSPTPTALSNDSVTTGSSQENGLPLTFEQEQTADELLADIQNAVDEMLENFQFNPVTKNSGQHVPPKTMKKPVRKNEMNNGTPEISQVVSTSDDPRVPEDGPQNCSQHVVKMRSRNGGFGFQVMGGKDSNISAQVDYIVPGSAADDSGLMVGDIILSVNEGSVVDHSHLDLVGAIKEAGATGELVLGVKRDMVDHDSSTQEPLDMEVIVPQNIPPARANQATSPPGYFSRNESFERWEEENRERMRQTEEIALLYPQRNGGSVDVSERNGLPAGYRREPLETLVEHQEEAMFEQMQEMMKVSSPLQSVEPASSSTANKRSFRTETPPKERPSFSPTSPILDDKETIEREIRELELMAAGKKQPQLGDSLSDSTNEESDNIADRNQVKTRRIVADSSAVTYNSFEVTESSSPLPMLSPVSEKPLQVEIQRIEVTSFQNHSLPSPPPHVSESAAHSSSRTAGSSELSLENEMAELLKLTSSTSPPPSLMQTTQLPSPQNNPETEEEAVTYATETFQIPPKPTAPAPKRAKRPAPPPPKNKVPKMKKDETGANGSPQTVSKDSSVVPEPFPDTVPVRISQSPPAAPSHVVAGVNDSSPVSPRRSNINSRQESTSGLQEPTEHIMSLQGRTVNLQERTVSPEERTVSPEERTVSPEERTVSPEEHTVSPEERTVSPEERTVSPEERTISPEERTVSPQEHTVSPSRELAVVDTSHTQEPPPPDKPQEPTVPEPEFDHLFSTPLRLTSSPLEDSFASSSLMRSDSPDLLTQMTQLAYSKNLTSGLADLKATSSSDQNQNQPDKKTSQPERRTSQPERRISQPDSSQMHQQNSSTHFSSPRKPHSDSNLRQNGPVAVVAPPIKASLIGSDSPDGGIKIQRVNKTRWTPRNSSYEPGSQNQTPDQVVPSITPTKQAHWNTPPLGLLEDRSATLPSIRHQNGRQKVSPSRERRGQDQAGGAAVMARGIGGAGGIGIGQNAKKVGGQQPQQQRSSSTYPYQPRNLQQAWKSQEELTHQRVNINASRKATTPDGTNMFTVKQSNSFSQGPISNQRSRSKTWSTQAAQDGFHTAYLIRPSNPHDLCSRCHQPLGQGSALSVPAVRTLYHTKCLLCRVCKTPLTTPGTAKTFSILMKNKQPHCKSCGGTSDGITFTTEC